MSDTNNLFATATRLKLRFQSPRGINSLAVEDLWDLPLKGSVSLDTVSQLANRDVKASEEESFVEPTTKANATAVLKLDVLKYIIAIRKAEKEAREKEGEKAERRRQILDLLAQKDSEADAVKTKEELLAELDAL